MRNFLSKLQCEVYWFEKRIILVDKYQYNVIDTVFMGIQLKKKLWSLMQERSCTLLLL